MENQEPHQLMCIGCSLAKKTLPVKVVYEDDRVTCILDHDPFNEGHTLIIPKQHFRYVDEFDDETAHAVMKAARLLSKAIKLLYKPDSLTICQNGGAADELTHYHMHIVPRYKGQSFECFFSEEPLENEHSKKRLPLTQKKLSALIDDLVSSREAGK